MKKVDWYKEFNKNGSPDTEKIKEKPKRIYCCTICGKKDSWSYRWSWYGSYLLSECIPDDIIYTCSNKCVSELDEKIHTKQIVVTEIVASGYNDFRIVKNRRGY